MSRRTLLRCLLFGGTANLLQLSIAFTQNTASQKPESESRSIHWRVPRAQVKEVRKQLKFEGEITGDPSSGKTTKGLPLIYLFVGIILVSNLAKTLLAVRRDLNYGGILIDARGEKVVIENDRRLPGGTIVVSTTKGVKVYQSDQKVDLTEIIAILVKAKK